MDSEEREVRVNCVGESRMDKTGVGGRLKKKVKGIGNVVDEHQEQLLQ